MIPVQIVPLSKGVKAARLQKQGKLEELKKMEETPMVRVTIIEEKDDNESEKPKDAK